MAGPGGATAAGKPRRPATEGRRLRGHSLRYLPAGKEDEEARYPAGKGLQLSAALFPPTPRDSPSHCSQNRCAGLFGIAVSAPAHTAPGRPLGMGGESRRWHQICGGRMRGAGGERAAGKGGRIQCVSFCSSRPASHWLQSGFSATTNRRLVLVSLCAWNSLEGGSGAEPWRFAPLSHRPAHTRCRPRPSDVPCPSPCKYLLQFPQSMMAL